MADVDLKELQRGSEDAWREAFRILWPIALHAAGRAPAGLQREEIEDAANDALAQLVRRIDSARSIEELRALAATIAYRRAISAARRNSAAKRIPAAAVSEDVMGHGDGESDGPEPFVLRFGELELAELAVLLRRALSELDGETQRMLIDKVCVGLTYRELGERYDKPAPTVAARVSRALAKVRAALARAPDLLQEIRAFLR